MSFRRRIRSLFRRDQLDRDMAEEMRAHLEEQVTRNVAGGMSDEDARAAAHRQFGGVAQIQERARDGRGLVWLNQFFQDLRHGIRTLRKNPLFAGVAVATLAMGIGANTAVFSVLHSVLIRPLPYPESRQLVSIWERQPGTGSRSNVSAANYLDWKEDHPAFEALGAYGNFGGDLQVTGPPERVTGARLTPDLIRMLGVQPTIGRGFSTDAEAHGPEILISDAIWQARFGGRPDVVGMSVQLNETPTTVVGVMPPTFEFPSRHLDFWQVLRFDATDRESRKTREWRVLGRLKNGVDLIAAQAAMDGMTARIATAHPEFMTGWGVNVIFYRNDLVRNLRPTVLILGGVVAAVLLVACANVANLMLARGAGRRRELAIRGALGAGRARIVRQLLAESTLLAGLGTIAGLLLAVWILQFLTTLAPGGLPGIEAPSLDAGALGFAAGAMLLAVGIVGLAPAAWLSRLDLRALLQGGRTESGGPLLRRMRNGLLVAQLALATVLLVGAGLLLRSMSNLHQVDVGFDPENLLAVTVDLPDTRYRTIAEQAVFYERVREPLEAIPGVLSVAGISDPPLAGSSTFSYVLAGSPGTGRETGVEVRSVTPGYFETVKLPLIEGRDFEVFDRAEGPAVAVVNRAFAQYHFSDGSAVGQRFSFTGQGGPWVEIVGVVEDVKDGGLDQPAALAIYTPYVQKRVLWQSALTTMIRTAGDPNLIREDIRRAFASVDAELPVPRINAMRELYAERLAQRDFMTRLITGFAALTLILGIVGVYGVISYSVAQRHREFGICLALGAARWNLVRRVLAEGMKPVIAGALLGGVGAMALARFLEHLLFEIEPLDPATFAGVIVLLGAVSLLALWLPARKAGSVDPLIALRAE